MRAANDLALARIRPHEGLRLCVYDDANSKPIARGTLVHGNPTIGYGCLLSQPGGITEAEADFLLANRIARAATDAATLAPFAQLDDVRQSVLIEMVFQMGLAGVSAFHNTLAAMQRGDFAAAASGMRASLWARQTSKRVNELADLVERGA